MIEQATALGLVSASLVGCGTGGPQSIDGCNDQKARTELREAVVSGKPFIAYEIDEVDGGFDKTTVQTKNVFILDPVILVCNGVPRAFAGIDSDAQKTTVHNSTTNDPVVIVPYSPETVFSSILPGDEIRADEVTFQYFAKKFRDDSSNQVPGFTDTTTDRKYGTSITGKNLKVLAVPQPLGPPQLEQQLPNTQSI